MLNLNTHPSPSSFKGLIRSPAFNQHLCLSIPVQPDLKHYNIIPWTGMKRGLYNWKNISQKLRDGPRKRESQMQILVRTIYQMI